MSLAYSRYFQGVQALIEDCLRLVDEVQLPERDTQSRRLSEIEAQLAAEAPLRVVLVGEFSAGKSSIISALTGHDVFIDADVATSAVSEHPWRGLGLVDTPGVQAEDTGTDHDRIAREATVGADLLLFVITNELFNPRLAQHLRYVLDNDGLGLAKKTSLIVNKMDREANPDEVIIGEVSKVLGPHQDIPVYLCAAGKYLRAATEKEQLKSRFIRQSRIPELVSGLDAFVSDAGTAGRLTTPLQVVSDVLDDVQSKLAASESDRKTLELIRRQRGVLQRLQRRLREIRKTWKQQAYSTVMGQANDAVEQITEVTTGDDLERLLKAGLKQAAAEIDQLYDGVESDVCEALDQASDDLDEIGDSPLGQDVRRIEAERAERVGVEFDKARPSGTTYVPRFVKAAGKPVQEGLNAAAKNAKGLRDVVYKVGKRFGKKFRPYEAVKGGEKLARAAGRAGKALPFLTAALDLYIQYREEKAKEQKARYLASLRLTLRSAFADQAKVEAEALEATVLKVSRGPVVESQERLDEQAAQVTAGARGRKQAIDEIARLNRLCTALRDEFYCGAQETAADDERE